MADFIDDLTQAQCISRLIDLGGRRGWWNPELQYSIWVFAGGEKNEVPVPMKPYEAEIAYHRRVLRWATFTSETTRHAARRDRERRTRLMPDLLREWDE